MKASNAKFLRTHIQYWSHSHELKNYRKRFSAIPEERLLEKMMKDDDSEFKFSWNQRTQDQRNELTTACTADQLSEPDVSTKLRQALNTTSNHEKFVDSSFDFIPDITCFNQVVGNVSHSRDIIQLWFDQRSQRYLKNVHVVKKRLNDNP